MQKLFNQLAAAKLFPTGLMDVASVQALMHTLHPVSCQCDLVRVGPSGDGGYLLPDDLEGIDACFSPGVGAISGFEKDCADLGMRVFLADRSVGGPAEAHGTFSFTNKFIGVTSNNDFMTLDDWVASSLPDSHSDLLLQIDIEGGEYEVFLSVSDRLIRRFRIIVAEFHILGQLLNRPFFRLASRAFEKILQTHACVHIHPNNCCGLHRMGELDIPQVAEFTFFRKDRITTSSYANLFPHPLDHDNTDMPSIILPACWHG